MAIVVLNRTTSYNIPPMPRLHHTVPDVSEEKARQILAEYWGLQGKLKLLAGERDRNYYVRAADGEFVLKVANEEDARSLLDLQNAALAHIAAAGVTVPVPRVVPAPGGDTIVEVAAHGGSLARLLTWVPGRLMAHARPHTADLLRHLGESLGEIDTALSSFRGAAARRDLKWDLAAAEWIADHVGAIDDRGRRQLVQRLTDRYVAEVKPALHALRRSVVHGDVNDFNVLVKYEPEGRARICGILDFGDIVESHPICDLAIALAYAMMNHPDPIASAVHVVAGFHARCPLQESELRLLLPLVRTRLAVSVTNSAMQQTTAHQNPYLRVSESGAWMLLEHLESVHDRFAEYRFREVCGFTPCAKSTVVVRWMHEHRDSFSPVMGYPLDTDNVHVLDLDVAGSDSGSMEDWQDPRRFTRLLFDRLRDLHAKAGIGRYDEVRPFYMSDVFQSPGNDGPEFRTVHTAIDIFLPAGASVFAPLGGTVVSVRDNDGRLDYGPTVIVEHRVDDGRLTFWTLYGHLSRESLPRLSPGHTLGPGDIVGWLGDEGVNGGWPPHLHFQIVCDLFDRDGDFPGVAKPAEREVWLSVSPDPSPMLGLPPGARAPRAASITALRDRRATVIGRSLSVSYRRPLNIVRGIGQYLFDADGQRYLDAVNNVAHVGHAHPDVVRAGQRQMAVLNTNTRYLHETLITYAERLRAMLPEPLSVCYFVCSGSEANELALRLARAHTGERDMIVLDAGYHGNTSTLVEVSSYKFDGPGGVGAPPWVQKVPMPDTFRGPFGRTDPEAGMKYAQAVREAVGRIRQKGARPSAFLCESILSCGGQIVLPPGYLAEAYRHVRAAGGVCIADEVQVGFGRVGSHFWGFQTQGVVPDIVTMGKPIGNGHPLGAVVTTPEIAASFANGMEYFNTFGGNPVSCAIGLEVLNVMEREGLQSHARDVGGYLLNELARLSERHPLAGDVRGLGLFIGVELVLNRDERIPATRHAAYVANRMRDCGVLMSTDGPDNNVLKVKPPLCFKASDADFLVETLDRVLSEDPSNP
jgi:4-aminobutyrate aminotransferase-like enzyme/Ser/Thr protein kinase RdoA (MazF antagonist)